MWLVSFQGPLGCSPRPVICKESLQKTKTWADHHATALLAPANISALCLPGSLIVWKGDTSSLPLVPGSRRMFVILLNEPASGLGLHFPTTVDFSLNG